MSGKRPPFCLHHSAAGLSALVLISFQLGCQPSPPPVSQQGRMICRQEAAALGLGTAAAKRRRAECLSSIDQRLAQEKAQRARDEAASALPAPALKVESPGSRYVYCTTHRLAVKAANDRVSSVLGPWMYANTNHKPGDADYEKAKADYEQAYAKLDQLIPPEMRNGLPLLPDAAFQFSTCNKDDFFPD